MARRTCSRQWRVKQSAQKPALWRRTSMMAGARPRRHFTPRLRTRLSLRASGHDSHCAPPDTTLIARLRTRLSSRASGHDRANLHYVVVVEAFVTGRERVVADHEHGFGNDLEIH